jgi:RNA polymerase sigma factor (sigma-70 family)
MARSSINGGQNLMEEMDGSEKSSHSLRVYRTYCHQVIIFAKNMVSNSADAEDITAEVFTKLWQRPQTMWDSPSIKAYLLTVTRNACIDFLKENRVKRELVSYDLDDPSFSEPLSAEEIISDLYHRYIDHLRLQISKLPKQRRRVVELSFFEGFSTKQIAEILNLESQTVINHRRMAIADLRLFIDRVAFAMIVLLSFLFRF